MDVERRQRSALSFVLVSLKTFTTNFGWVGKLAAGHEWSLYQDGGTDGSAGICCGRESHDHCLPTGVAER